MRIRHRHAALRALARFHAQPRSLDEIVDRAIDLGTAGDYRVKSVQIRAEIAALAAEVARLEPRTVLEIGTHRAGTFFLWSQFATRRVVSCDVVPPGPRAALYPHFAPPAREVDVVALTGDSHDPAFRDEVERCLGGEPVDFLFIDGDHTEAGVEADYRDYATLVRAGGLIAFHDIHERQAIETNEVHRFWQRLTDELSDVTHAFVASGEQTGFGIGVLRVPEPDCESR